MVVLRKVDNVSLNEGDCQAKGLYNLTNDKTDEVSLWFGEETKNELLKETDVNFLDEARVAFEVAEL